MIVLTNAITKLGESGVNRRFARLIAALVAVMLCALACAGAEGAVSTTVVMRVSHLTQNAMVNAGEDLSIEVRIDGVEPAKYQWYFNDAPIEGANQKVYNIVNAQPEDTGVYRLDAFDDAGSMLVSMDIVARVKDDSVPQSGDGSMPVGFAFAGIAVCAALLAVLLRRRRLA